MGQEISNELQNKTPFVIPKPEYSQAIQDKHVIDKSRQTLQSQRVFVACATKLAALTIAANGRDIAAGLELTIL